MTPTFTFRTNQFVLVRGQHWVVGAVHPNVFGEPQHQAGEGIAHRIFDGRKKIGHISGFAQDHKDGERFHVHVTTLSSESHRGKGHWQSAVRAIAKHYPGGVHFHTFDTSTAAKKAIRKIPGVIETPDDFIVKHPIHEEYEARERVRTSKGHEIHVSHGTTGAGHGQIDGYTAAHTPDGKYLGHVSWSDFQGTRSINHIEVEPEHQRKGVAAALVHAMVRGHEKGMVEPVPYRKIRWGMTTPDGTRLKTEVDRHYSALGEAFLGYKLSPDSREKLLKAIPPLYGKVVADHITTDFLGDRQTAFLPADPRRVEVIGHAHDAEKGIHAAVIRVDGREHQGMDPDRRLHVTISHGENAKPVHANDAIKKGWKRFEHPISLDVKPFLSEGVYDWGHEGPAPWNASAAWISPSGTVHDVGFTKSGARRTHLGWIKNNLGSTGVKVDAGKKLDVSDHVRIAHQMVHAGWIRKANSNSYEYHERHDATHERRVMAHVQKHHPDEEQVFIEVTGDGPGQYGITRSTQGRMKHIKRPTFGGESARDVSRLVDLLIEADLPRDVLSAPIYPDYRVKGGSPYAPDKSVDVEQFLGEEADKPKIDWHLKYPERAYISWFQVPKHMRGQGVGRAAYKKWEKELPASVTHVELHAADSGDGPSDRFWQKMGFMHRYDFEDPPHPSSREYEHSQLMHKGIRGHKTPETQFIPAGDVEESLGHGPGRTRQELAMRAVRLIAGCLLEARSSPIAPGGDANPIYQRRVERFQSVVGDALIEAVSRSSRKRRRARRSLLPTRRTAVYHVGDLDKGRVAPTFSYEGGELSVSHHPEAWKKIAKLGGRPTYHLHNPNARFYDVANRKHENSAVKWSVDNGYLENTVVHRVSWYDSEFDRKMYSEHHSDDDLLRTHGSSEEMAEDGKKHTIKSGFKFGPKGEEYYRKSFPQSSKVDHAAARAFAPIFYARHHGYDGVMWHERYDPDNLSAPRGLIFQEKLSSFKKTKLKEERVDELVFRKSISALVDALIEGDTDVDLYHVTHTRHVPSIKKRGLTRMNTSNWVKAGDKSRYGEGEVYAFTHENDAQRWAAKMDWEFNKEIGSGKISVVHFKGNREHWERDTSDAPSQAMHKGHWMKSQRPVAPDKIHKIYPLGNEHLAALRA